MGTLHDRQGAGGPAPAPRTDTERWSPTRTRRATTRQARLAIFDAAAAIVAREFADQLTIEDVAARVAVSPRQLQRIFTDVRRVGFRTHLARVRMARAAELLAQTELPVKEVAQRVGYRDHSQFSKAFKRTYGITPFGVAHRASSVAALELTLEAAAALPERAAPAAAHTCKPSRCPQPRS
jgi:AraC-like DNA-binding protein